MNKNYDSFISKVFLLMTTALLTSGVVAYACSYIPALTKIVSEPMVNLTFVILELILVVAISAFIDRLENTILITLFYLYSFISGITFSSIFLRYELGSILGAFIGAMLMFAGCWMVKKMIKINVPLYSNLIVGALLGLIVVEIIAMFIPGLNPWVCALGIVIFLPLTIYDMKKMDYLYQNFSSKQEIDNVAIYCALELYLDIVNIMLRLLRLFGKKKD